MRDVNDYRDGSRTAGLTIVIGLHFAVICFLWNYRIEIHPNEAATIFVNMITSTQPPRAKELPIPRPPEPVKPVPPESQRLVAEVPAVIPSEPVASPPPEPVLIAEPLPEPAGPFVLSSQLSVSCAERVPPAYPAQSRRRGEQGRVVLRVELSESGRVVAAAVQKGSGFSRLDDAALAAVKGWRCNPAIRNGAPVQAVALQPFDFILKGH